MSSILDALEKLERGRQDGSTTGTSPSSPPPPRRRGPGLIVAGIAAAAAALAFTILRSPGPEGIDQTPVAPEPAVAPDAAVPPPGSTSTAAAPRPEVAAPATPVPAAGATPPASAAPAPAAPPAEPPTVEPAPVQAAAPPPPAVPGSTPDGAHQVLAAAPPIPPPTDGEARPWGKPFEPPPGGPVVRVPPAPPLVASARPREPEPPPIRRTPAGAPKVQLSFLLFSGSPDRRSVALSIDGGGLETLHEGETSGGLEVVRILPDRVDLRWEGEPFTVRARD